MTERSPEAALVAAGGRVERGVELTGCDDDGRVTLRDAGGATHAHSSVGARAA